MKLNELKFNKNSKQAVKRLGRGSSSGTGKTSGKGHKGQKARSGGGINPVFEGGQSPLYRRIPKKGFSNAKFKTVYSTINVEDFNSFDDGARITPELLKDMNIIKNQLSGIKVLGNGELTKKVTVSAHKFSKIAKQKIEEAGGKVEVI